jgi:hypothetical protein
VRRRIAVRLNVANGSRSVRGHGVIVPRVLVAGMANVLAFTLG